MSEWMYACLLRLYPSQFRKEYSRDALQLYRDRWRDETGLPRRLRLSFDLLTDVFAGLPQAYRNSYATRATGSLAPTAGDRPLFRVLEKERLWPGAVLAGGVFSIAALAAVGSLMNRAISYQPISGSNETMSPVERVLERVNEAKLPDSAGGGDGEAAVAPSRRASAPQPGVATAPVLATSLGTARDTGRVDRGAHSSADSNSRSTNAQTERGLVTPQMQRNDGEKAAGIGIMQTGDATEIDAAERRRVINAAAMNLKEHYFDHAIAQKTADALLAHESNGDDNAATSGEALADLLTKQMHDASSDMHLSVEYSRDHLPEAPPAPTPESQARFQQAMLQANCMFRKVEILPHNIGYVKLDFFPATGVCEPTARRAMASLNDADALIFDLRENTGGFPDMVSLMASYLFDHPEYMYSPRGAPTDESWTRSPVPGNRLADKPVYVLTSGATWSGAEQFSYDLKMLKRATLVGETTRGGAHAGVFHRIDDHFGMGIPEERAVNPFGKTDWEGIGVEPDIKVKAADALKTAEKLAEGRLGRK